MCGKRSVLLGFVVLGTIVLLSAPWAAAAPASAPAATSAPASARAADQSPAVLLEKGIYAQETKGNLDEAISIYEQVVHADQASRRAAAEALWRLGQCWEKKGDKAKAAQAYDQLLRQYPEQEAFVSQARQKRNDTAAAAAQLPPETLVSIMSAFRESVLEAQNKDLHVNAHVFGVDEAFNCVQGGLLLYRNNSDSYVTDEVDLGGFSERPTFDLIFQDGVVPYTVKPAPEGWLGRYRLMWKPYAPIPPGAVYVFGYKQKVYKTLPDTPQGHPVHFQNTFGAPVLESFYLVVPQTISIASSSRPFTSRQSAGGLDVYTWKREVPADTKNEVDVYLKSGSATSRAAGPNVVSTSPKTYADNVPATTTELAVTFDQAMRDGSWSWTHRFPEADPQFAGNPKYDSDLKTCRIPVKLEPGKWYWVGINSPGYQNFKNSAGVSSAPYVLVFATASEDGKPTPIPADKLEMAKQINAAASAQTSGIITHLPLQDAPIREVLRQLSNVSQKNIVPGRNVHGTVTADLFNVTWREALDAIMRVSDLGAVEEGNFIYVYPLKEIDKHLATASQPSEGDRAAAETLAAQGAGLLDQHKNAEAQKLLEQAVKLDPTKAKYWKDLGWALLEQDQDINAKRTFEKALAIDPKAAYALNGMGVIAKDAGQTEQAVYYWKQALAASPDAIGAAAHLAKTYMEKKDYDKAAEFYQYILKFNPDDAQAKEGLAKANGAKAGKS